MAKSGPRKKAALREQEMRNIILDSLEEFPGSVTDVCFDTDISARVVRHLMLQMEAEGLIEEYMRLNNVNLPCDTVVYALAKTKKGLDKPHVPVSTGDTQAVRLSHAS